MQIDLNKVSTINVALNKTLKAATNDELARATVDLDAMMENVKAAFDAAKAEILSRSDFERSTYFADEKLKVVINDGKTKVDYNVSAIGKAFESAGRINDFMKIVKVIGGQVEEHITEGDPLRAVIANNKTEEKGNPYVSVSKMTKEEISKSAA